MKIFLDTANLESIRKFNDMGLLDGITTNPSLLSKEGGNPKNAMEEITKIIKGDVSLEVVSTEYSGMMDEGKRLREYGDLPVPADLLDEIQEHAAAPEISHAMRDGQRQKLRQSATVALEINVVEATENPLLDGGSIRIFRIRLERRSQGAKVVVPVALLLGHHGEAEIRQGRAVRSDESGEDRMRLVQQELPKLFVALVLGHLQRTQPGPESGEATLVATGMARGDAFILHAGLLVQPVVEERVRHRETGDHGPGASRRHLDLAQTQSRRPPPETDEAAREGDGVVVDVEFDTVDLQGDPVVFADDRAAIPASRLVARTPGAVDDASGTQE